MTEPAYVDIYQKGATVTMYFSAVLDAEPAAWGAFSGEQTFAGERSRTGVGQGSTCVSTPASVSRWG